MRGKNGGRGEERRGGRSEGRGRPETELDQDLRVAKANFFFNTK